MYFTLLVSLSRDDKQGYIACPEIDKRRGLNLSVFFKSDALNTPLEVEERGLTSI